MDIKIKTLYSDRVKPTDLVDLNGLSKKETGERIEGIIKDAVNKILDDNDTMVGIYISRE